MSGKTVLIVDDTEDTRTVLALWLQTCDFSTIEAGSASEALSLLGTKTPDLIFLDHHMPEMDGMQLLRILKRTDGLRHIPVVFFTGSDCAEDAIEAGAHRFIRKGDSQWAEIPAIANTLCSGGDVIA